MLRIEEGIEIVDKAGRPRIVLTVDEIGSETCPKIELLDDFGCSRISIYLEKERGGVAILHENGDVAVGIGTDENGGGLEASMSNDPYARVHLLPLGGEYRLMITRKDNRQTHPDGSLSAQTATFPEKQHENK
ncbi:MAG: hypothetical protein Q4C70_06045 [Planctomycetia bacterium]|nr:hypothetical protein [Planctomycetia bacterium]